MKRTRDQDEPYEQSTKRYSGSPTSAPRDGVHPDEAAAASAASNNQVFVGSCSYETTEADLREFFASCGQVRDIRIPTYPDSGRPRGIAFVEFADDNAASRAIEMDGMELLGRSLKISIAVSRNNGGGFRRGSGANEYDGGSGGGGGYRGGRTDYGGGSSGEYGSSASRSAVPPPRGARPEGCRTVFVGNLSWNTDEPAMSQCFERCGRVSSVRIVSDRDTGRSRGFGYVEFEEEDSVEAALRLSGTDLDGRQIRVDYAADRRTGGAGGSRGGGSTGYSERADRGYSDRGYERERGGDRGYERERGADRGYERERGADRGYERREYSSRDSGRSYSDRGDRRESYSGRVYESSRGSRDYGHGAPPAAAPAAVPPPSYSDRGAEEYGSSRSTYAGRDGDYGSSRVRDYRSPPETAREPRDYVSPPPSARGGSRSYERPRDDYRDRRY